MSKRRTTPYSYLRDSVRKAKRARAAGRNAAGMDQLIYDVEVFLRWLKAEPRRRRR